MSVSKRGFLKAVLTLVDAKKPYYIIRAYDSGKLLITVRRIVKPEYAERWFLYNQSLIEYGYVRIVKRRGGRTVCFVFDEASGRQFELFLLYILSISNLKSPRRIDCLAKCWSQIDAVSPLIDVFLELERITDEKRFIGLLRGYCLCR